MAANVEVMNESFNVGEAFTGVAQCIELLDKAILKADGIGNDAKESYRTLREYIRNSRDESVQTGMDLYKAITLYGLYKEGDRFAIELNDTSPYLSDQHKYKGVVWVECSSKYVQGPTLCFVPGSGLGNVFSTNSPRYWNAVLCGRVKETIRKR